MSFLKKLGEVVNVASGVIPVFGPLVGALVPKAAPAIQNMTDELPAIAAIIIRTEAIGQAMQLPGAKKLEVSAPLVAQIILNSALARDKHIKDRVLFMKGVTEMSAGMADILNSFDETGVTIK